MDLRKIGLRDIEFWAYRAASARARKGSRACVRKMAKRAKLRCKRAWKKEMLP
jgi:hypothetical protein